MNTQAVSPQPETVTADPLADLLSKPLARIYEQEQAQPVKKTPRQILEEVKVKIMEECGRFNMAYWIQGSPRSDIQGRINDFRTSTNHCGTAACIAGWACILNSDFIDESSMSVKECAASLLGVGIREAGQLFVTHRWPLGLVMEHHEANQNRNSDPCGPARVACKAIDWWMEEFNIQ